MKAFYFLMLLFCFGSSALPQDSLAIKPQPKQVQYDTDSSKNPLDFDEESLERFKADKDFDYTEADLEENWWTRFKAWIGDLWDQFWDWVFDGVSPGPFWSIVIKLLPYLIVLGAVAFIIWLFYKLNPGASIFRSKKKPEVFFTEEEEIIKTKDIHKLIDKAFRSKNYRLAIRYYFLLILQKLSESEVIEYEFDKTNSDYVNEINLEDVKIQFIKTANLYDYIWYGSFTVSEEDYHTAKRTFNSLEHRLDGIKPKARE